MCGRYVTKEQRDFERNLVWLDVKHWPQFDASYTVAPTQPVPVIRATAEGNVCDLLRWGLIPFFAKGVPPKYSTINARIESIETAASYRGPWNRAQRWLMLAQGFFEWHVNKDGRKQPFYIHLAGHQEAFGFAGLWGRSVTADGTATDSCTIITMPANSLMADIHNAPGKQRMPAMLRKEDQHAWLSGAPDDARAALREYPADLTSIIDLAIGKVNS